MSGEAPYEPSDSSEYVYEDDPDRFYPDKDFDDLWDGLDEPDVDIFQEQNDFAHDDDFDNYEEDDYQDFE